MNAKTTMYLGSMDHSPGEQLGEACDWHTTVLVLSEGGEHWKFAADLAKSTNCKDDTLVRWSDRRTKRRPAYAKQFEKALANELGSYPVHVHAISARAETIKASQDHILSELGLSELVQFNNKKGKTYLNFGSFQKVRIAGDRQGNLQYQTEPANFELPERQAISLLFICHFVLRVHQRLMQILKIDRPHLEGVDLQMMPNKFPGDIDGPMGSLFHGIMSGATHRRLVAGKIRIAIFNESKADQGSALADNIAGLIAEKLDRDEFELSSPEPNNGPSSMCWEVWRSAEHNSTDS